MQGVLHLVELKEGKAEQLLRGCGGQRLVLFDGEGGKSMPGLRRDDNACAPASDDIAERFQHEGRAIQIDFKDRRR